MDDEESIREGIRIALEPGYRVRTFPDAESSIEAVKEDPPDLVLMDIGLPGMSGVEGIRAIKALRPETLIIVITAYEDVQTVVGAMKGGAFDYLVKPLHMETLETTIGNALETVRLHKEVRELQERFLREKVPLFVGESHAIREVMEFVESVAKSPDTPVLILGPTGTGKELVAAAIHYRSPNFRGPLVSVNCAAIPKELARKRAVRVREGRLHWREPRREEGAGGGGIRRNTLPRRGGGPEPGGPGETAEVPRGRGVLSRRGDAPLASVGKGRVRNQQGTGKSRPEGALPGGPLLSACGRTGGGADPVRPARRHPSDRALLPRWSFRGNSAAP